MSLTPFVGSATAEPSTGKHPNGVSVEGQRAQFGSKPGPQQQAATSGENHAAPPAEPTQLQSTPEQLLAKLQQGQTVQPKTPESEVPQSDGTRSDSDEGQQVAPNEDREAMRSMLQELVKQELGYDLSQLQQQQEKQRLQNEASQLQQLWGVSQQEMVQRLNVLSSVIENLPEHSQQAFTNPIALNILWTAVQAQSTDRAPAWNSAPSSIPSPTQLTEQEIDSMSREEYKRRQPEIMAFYQQRANR